MIESIRCLEDALAAARELRFRLQYPLWWRGHANASWSLVPKIFRGGQNYTIESNMALRFRMRARTRHPSCPDDDDNAGWLNLMQHYGLPTRLLDWSESPLTALFFAIEADHGSDGRLWVLSPARLNRAMTGVLFLAVSDRGEARELIDDVFDEKTRDRRKAIAIMPKEVDARMLLQHSTFTIHGTAEPLNQLIADGDIIRSFVIPSSEKDRLREDLELVGISRATIFPDLENLSADIAWHEWRNARP